MLRVLLVAFATLMLTVGDGHARMAAGFGLCQAPLSSEAGPATIIAQTTEGIAAYPRSGGSHSWLFQRRGSAYLAMNDFDRAIEDFDNVLVEYDQRSTPPPNDQRIDVLTKRGRALGEKGDYQRAIRDFDTALALSPHSDKALLERGVAFRLAGQEDRAIEDFNRVILLTPGTFGTGRAFIHRAAVYVDKGDYDRARKDLEVARQLDLMCRSEIENNLCWIDALQGKPRAAVLSPDGFDSALVEFWRGRLPTSLEICGAKASGGSALRDSRAFVYLQLGQLADARAESEAAVRLAPRDGEVRYMLAMILEAEGDGAAATREFAEAQRLAKPGEWVRWERRQGRFRGLAAPVTVERQAEQIVAQTMTELARVYARHPEALRRLDLKAPPLRVAALLFDDKEGTAEPHCRKDVVDALAKDVANFNRALGHVAFEMSDVDRHDILFVMGGPKSIPGVEVDARSTAILAAEQRQTTQPHEERFVSYAPAGHDPSEWIRLYYHQNTGALLYGVVGHSWRFLDKACSARFAEDLEMALSEEMRGRLFDIERDAPDAFKPPRGLGDGLRPVETCFLAGRDKTPDDSMECVRRLVELTAFRPTAP
jgi:tetratricopeptide (TPR) repeat protein